MMGELQQRSEAALRASGHTGCDYLRRARYDAASGMVVCGCGIFTELGSEAPAQPANEQSAAVVSTGIAYVAADPIESTLALIDPTEVYAPEDVERHILDVLARLEMGEKFERQVIEKHYEAKQAYDLKFSASILASQETGADRRKADAMIKCTDEYQAMNEAEFMRKAVQATMHNLRAVLTGYQSVSRSVGAAYQAGGAQHSHTRQR